MKENLIKVIVYPKTRQTKKGVKFTTYSAPMFLVDSVQGSETEGQVIQKSISVKFGKDVDSNLILKTPMLLTCKEEDVSAPSRYLVKEETNEQGEEVKIYPVVWINGILSSKSYKAPVNQSQFAVSEKDLIEDEETELKE